MFDSKKDMFLEDLPEEVKSETKYLSKFFLWFVISYFTVYAFLEISVSVVSSFDFCSKVENIVVLSISQLMMPLILILAKVFTRSLRSSLHPVMDTMSFLKFLKILLVSVFVLFAGSVMASYTVSIVTAVKGSVPQNYVAMTVEEMSLAEIFVFVVVLAPIFEELVFRKFVIDKLSKYGTSFSVFVSAFMFGVIHGNFYQFFYAFGLGALMGYVYCIYGKIRYPVLIHCFINTLGSIVPIMLRTGQTSEVSSFQMLYILVYMSLVICGGILFFKNFKQAKFFSVGGVLMFPSKMLFKSRGFILFASVFSIILIYNTII